MIKVGIYTLFYENYNYGGILQAYALRKKVEEMGYDCKIINYDCSLPSSSKLKNIFLSGDFKELLRILYKFYNQNKKNKMYSGIIKLHIEKINKFKEANIACSKKYNYQTINYACNDFDIFICGSDQVWNMSTVTFNPTLFFSYVPSNKLKIAYAASFGRDNLSSYVQRKARPLINQFDYLSVREQQGHTFLKAITNKPVEIVADPVFLLEQKNWNTMANLPAHIKEPYIFCYFLGDFSRYTNILQEFSELKRLKIVTIPYLTKEQIDIDYFFSDIQIEAAPPEFIGLIQNAEYILTDSFHAIAFSIIYNKRFYTFKRIQECNQGSIDSRINTLLSLAGVSERLVDEEFIQQTLLADKDINYEEVQQKMNEMRLRSEGFLRNALKHKSVSRIAVTK